MGWTVTSMRMPGWLVTGVIAALLLAACGQPAVPAGSLPGATGAPGGSNGATPTPGPSGAVAEPSGPVFDLTDPAGSVTTEAVAARALDRARVGLGDLGPGATDLAAAMDEAGGRLLATLTGEASVDPLDGQLASLRSVPSRSGLHATVAGEGYQQFMVFATMINVLDDMVEEPKQGTIDLPDETVDICGNSGTITSSMTIVGAVQGSTLSVDLTQRTKGKVVDKATGATLFSIDTEASGHIDLVFCPDASGHTTAHVKLTSQESYSGGSFGGGRSVSKEFSADVGITVGDDANIAAIDGSMQGSEATQGAVGPAGGGASDGSPTSRQVSDTIATDGAGHRRAGAERDLKVGGEGTTFDDQVKLWGSTDVFMSSMVRAAADEASKSWQGGKCVELIVDPAGGDVEPDSTTTVTARLHHKIDGNDLDKPIVAQLSGVESIDPDDVKQPAPATVAYTAGSEEGDHGYVSFKSVSNRGIATLGITFIVRPAAWTLSFTGTDSETFPPVVANTLKASIEELHLTATGTVLKGSGELHLRGTVTTPACTGKLDQVATVKVSGTVAGTGVDTVLRFTMTTASPPGGVVRMHCTVGGGADIPAEGHAERFGDVVMQVELPVAGGTLALDRSQNVGGVLLVRIKGTFTLARVH